MSCDRTGEHYFAALNHVGGQRGASLAIAVSVAISATLLLLIGSPIIARAATIEEVGWELFRLMLEVASGKKKTWAEQWKLHNALVLFNPAPVT